MSDELGTEEELKEGFSEVDTTTGEVIVDDEPEVETLPGEEAPSEEVEEEDKELHSYMFQHYDEV